MHVRTLWHHVHLDDNEATSTCPPLRNTRSARDMTHSWDLFRIIDDCAVLSWASAPKLLKSPWSDGEVSLAPTKMSAGMFAGHPVPKLSFWAVSLISNLLAARLLTDCSQCACHLVTGTVLSPFLLWLSCVRESPGAGQHQHWPSKKASRGQDPAMRWVPAARLQPWTNTDIGSTHALHETDCCWRRTLISATFKGQLRNGWWVSNEVRACTHTYMCIYLWMFEYFVTCMHALVMLSGPRCGLNELKTAPSISCYLIQSSEHFSLLPLFLLVIFSWHFWILSFYIFVAALS